MSDLTEFLLARIAEDEADARDATPGPWNWVAWDEAAQAMGRRNLRADGEIPLMVGLIDFPIDLRHIARHDPSRVLAECEAKRRIVGDPDHRGGMMYEYFIRVLAAVYADHPDYPEPR